MRVMRVKPASHASQASESCESCESCVSQREIEVFNPQAWDSHLRRESWQVYSMCCITKMPRNSFIIPFSPSQMTLHLDPDLTQEQRLSVGILWFNTTCWLAWLACWLAWLARWLAWLAGSLARILYTLKTWHWCPAKIPMKNRMKNKILQVKPGSLTLHWLQVTKNKGLF